ncbi:unnamed protein product [Litomosoides sigmodontis]|uniref:Calponin-homology (CH) domain-containing protein n=1 Tax=Litomosoides sigmodontis TaxID=42156 RepID=A0A3P6TZI5_LITSI|nr:unnamed protein product [Litomosoides sigmodontis]
MYQNSDGFLISHIIQIQHNSSELVEDLFKDLRDGVLLCRLIELLTGEALPINKIKDSKRVHHISNLTVALSALRRRGLDLVNNNPADIANGNPRIICGLIWQMILHFQIETNVQLLKEWGFELELANSPSTSTIDKENSPLVKSPQKLRVGRLKAPVDRVVLRWVNAQLARPYNINLTDMDKSWRDGIAFNALIHRIRPELVDMDVVHQNAPKTNLEQAFRLAKEHLHIRPLLDVEDMLCDKSDKRSVITYVSQFIRTLKHLRPITTCPMIDDRTLISWMGDTLNMLKSSVNEPLYDQYQKYLSLRKQYFEHRNVYYSLRERVATLPEGEWNQIQANWKRIGDLLEDWSHNLECEMPGKLSELAQWLCTAEQLIQNPVDVRMDDAQLSLSNINESISHHKIHFSEFPYRSERFQSIYLSRKVDECEVSLELLEPLKVRFNALATAAPCRLQYLHRVQAYYRLLSNTEALNQKMERWKSGDSAAAIQKSMKEYKMEAESAPEKKFKRLLAHLKEVYSEASSEETDCVIKQCEDVAVETVEKFQQLKPNLDELFKFWREFESAATKIEGRITRSEREKRNLFDENDKELLRHCERIRDDIGSFGNDQAQQVVDNRLSEFRRRISAIKRKVPAKVASQLQEDALPKKVARIEATLPDSENNAAATLDTQHSEHNRLQKWLISAHQQMSTVVTDLNSLERAINEVSGNLREVQEVENERMALLKARIADNEQSIGEYRKLRTDLQTLLQHMKIVHPLFLSFEKNYDNLLNLLNNQDDERDSKGNKKNDIIAHMTFLVETLSQNDYKKWINCDLLQQRMDELKNRMKETREPLVKVDESSNESSRIAALAVALTKKKKLLGESVDSWEDIKIWVDNVTEINKNLELICAEINSTAIPISDEFKNEKEKLQEEWHQKTEAIDQLQKIRDAIEILRKKLTENLKLSEVILLSERIDSLNEQCMNVIDPSVRDLRNCYLTEIAEELRTAITESFSKAERRISELSAVDETDVRRAVVILQDYEQEAKGIVSNDPRLLEVVVAIREAQKTLQAKMDFFASLQHFYEALNAIKEENEQWHSITSQQVEEVSTRIEELLKLVETKCAPEANDLCSQFECIRSSFFQLECDRIKEKLRVLILQLDRLVDFMAKRKILILKFKEFQKFAEDAEDTLLRKMHTASIGAEVDTNEMSGVFDKLDNLGKELTACQLDAKMTISDISIVDILKRIKSISTGVDSIGEPVELSKRFQEFFDVSNQLERAFCTDIHNCEHLDDVVEFITISLDNGKKEAELMVRLVAIADGLIAHEKSKANDILTKLKRIMDKRQELRRVTVEDCVERSLVILAQKEDELEKIIERDIKDQNVDAFGTDEVTKWLPLKEELVQLTVLFKNNNIQGRDSLDKLVEKATNFDAQIACFKNTFDKTKRREQRMSVKLATFAKWIDLVEEDLNRAESSDDTVEKAERLRNIHDICLSHDKLVNKLLSSGVNPPLSSEVKFHCDRYFTLLQRSDVRDLPEGQTASTDFSGCLSSSILSQLSLSTLSTSESDEEMSHGEEVTTHEATSSANDLTQQVLQAKEISKIRLLLSDTDSELNVLADSLNGLNADYARSLKPLSIAQADLEKLKELNERRCQLKSTCDSISGNVSGDDLAVTRSLVLHLNSLEEPFTTFMGGLKKEIDDEITLQSNYKDVLKKFSELDIDTNKRTQNAIQVVRNQLEEVQSELNLLRVQCSQQRKYVENTLESISSHGNLGEECSRRKKIMLMVSTTVTTITKVVEDELRYPSTTKEIELAELKQKLQDVKTSIIDQTGEEGDANLSRAFDAQQLEKSKTKKEQVREMLPDLDNVAKAEKIEPYDEGELAKVKEQLQQQRPVVEDEDVKVEHDLLEKEMEMKFAEILNQMNAIQTNVSQIMEEEETDGEKRRRDEKALSEFDQQINALELALNETADKILPMMNELISQSHPGSITLPSLQSELENAKKFAEECKRKLDEKLTEKEQMREMMQSENEKLSLENQLQAHELAASATDKLKDYDRSDMTNDEQIDMERMLSETVSHTDKSRASRESIASEGELGDELRAVTDSIEGLLASYAQPQPYRAAINDMEILQGLQDQITELLQKATDKQHDLSTSHPAAINEIKQKIEKAEEDAKKLSSSLAEDVSTEKQLVDMQNDLINRMKKMNDCVIMIRNGTCEETEIPRLEELKNELEEVSGIVEELKEKESRQPKLVLHSDELSISSVDDQYEKLNQLLNETEERLMNEVASVSLQRTIDDEAKQLHDMVDEAYKVENDVNATASNLQKAIDDLKSGRSHLAALQDICEKLEGMPDMDSLYAKSFNEISTLNEQYDNVERNLEDRLAMLNEFNEVADSVSKQLMDLEDNVRKLETPSASCELSIANKGINDVNELRKSLEKLCELKEELTPPLLKPASTVEEFDNRLSDVNKSFQQWHDDIVKKKQEMEAENNLSTLINDFKETLVKAENDFEKVDGTMDALKSFRDMTLPIVVEKSDRIRDVILPVKTENIEELYRSVDMLTDRYNNLSTRVNDKLNDAQEEENHRFDEVQRELNDSEEKVNDFANKYATPQDLLVAMEDISELRSLLDQIPSSEMEDISELELKENLLAKADAVEEKIKNLLLPLEKDVEKEQELMQDLHEILTTLTTIGDDVIAVDPISEASSSEQLESIGQLAENLRELKGRVEELEEKLQQCSEGGMVKRALVTDDLFGRVVQLQDALDDKKGKLADRAKLYAIASEINSVNESVLNEMEQIQMMQTVEEQNAALNKLEGMKHQLESLLENIPQNDEGNELQEKGNLLLGQVSDLVKGLTDAVGKEHATFDEIKDEIEAAQLSSLQALPTSISDETAATASERDDQLDDINRKLATVGKLKNEMMISDSDEGNLDADKITERQNLLPTIDEALDRLKVKVYIC